MLALSALIAGCNQSRGPAFELTDVTGAGFGRELTLTDHTGKTRTLADFKGKAVAIFFGYTHCPDVCPVTLSEMAAVANDLGKDADRLQVLFVTVDPERDTPKVLKDYLSSFDPRIVGVTGDEASIARVVERARPDVESMEGAAFMYACLSAGVPFAEVRAHLPADTPVVPPEERSVQLRARREGALLRRIW